MSRVLLANLAQETCSFVQSKHTLDDFRRYYLYTGQEIIEKLRGGGMEVSAMIAAAEEEGIELVPLLATYSGTGSPVTTAAYAYFREEILAGAGRHVAEVDGAILALHGAMLTEELDVLADASDGTAGGAEGDSTVLLQALLESPVPGPCLLLVTDPEAVAVCAKAGVGAEVTLEVGGKLTPAFFRPVQVTGRVRTLSDGRFRMKLPPIPADRGLTTVLQVGGIFLVLSQRPIYTWDEECYRSVGLFPREAKVVQVKSPGGFRPIYEPFARGIIDLDAPGPTDSNLARLLYRRVTRPLFPLDDI